MKLLVLLIALVSPPTTRIIVWKWDMLLEVEHNGEVIARFQICDIYDRYAPKRAEGDMRTPEGVYPVTYMGPSGSYKSIAIGYPTPEEKRRGYTGGDVAIHGKCCSSGCIGLSNSGIDALFRVLAKIGATPKTCIVDIRFSKDTLVAKARKFKHPEF